jgi:hypothetical protein
MGSQLTSLLFERFGSMQLDPFSALEQATFRKEWSHDASRSKIVLLSDARLPRDIFISIDSRLSRSRQWNFTTFAVDRNQTAPSYFDSLLIKVHSWVNIKLSTPEALEQRARGCNE